MSSSIARGAWIYRAGMRFLTVILLMSQLSPTLAQQAEQPLDSPTPAKSAPVPLTQVELDKIDEALDEALKWLSTQQQPDGAFTSIPVGQPGVTGLCVLAYLSRGHQPDVGPYGKQLAQAIDFVLSCQHEDGLFCQADYGHVGNYPMRHAAPYNHAVAGLMLGEVYGTTGGKEAGRIKLAIEQALDFTRKWQERRPRKPGDAGGWRYLRLFGSSDSDLSVTA